MRVDEGLYTEYSVHRLAFLEPQHYDDDYNEDYYYFNNKIPPQSSERTHINSGTPSF
jgi:thiamine phosphate synthase YjbQ (UPF0047 family)